MAAVNGDDCCYTTSSNVQIPLANSPGPPQRPFSSCGRPSATPAERGHQGAMWRERMANSEFANGIRPIDRMIKRPPGERGHLTLRSPGFV